VKILFHRHPRAAALPLSLEEAAQRPSRRETAPLSLLADRRARKYLGRASFETR